MNRYLVKIAESEIGEHQKRVQGKLDSAQEGEGLIVAHGMGSGKTLTALKAAEKAHSDDKEGNVVVITPASLTTNFDSQAEEHKVKIDKKRFHTFSYDKAVNNVEAIKALNPKLVIFDEGHKLRNTDTDRYKAAKDILTSTKAKPLILTGTPDYNKPSDMRVLINLAAGKEVVPADEKEFNDKYIGTRKVKPSFVGRMFGAKEGEVKYLKNHEDLRGKLSKYMDIYDGKTQKSEDFPSSHEELVPVTMSKKQHDLYRYLENDLPAPIRWKVRLGLPLDKKEAGALNSFSTGVRQVSNSTQPYSKSGEEPPTPKIDRIVKDHLEAMEGDKNFRGVIYSNYLEAGLNPISKELSKRGVKHEIYDGTLSAKKKDDMVKRYNEGETPTLLVSSSGSEGLNLKGTKIVQVAEPHFNKKKIDQVVARGIRFRSHHHLPEEERHVTVKHYHSALPKGLWDNILGTRVNSIDEYLHKMSTDKEHVGTQMKQLVATDHNHYASGQEKVAQEHMTTSEIIVDKLTNPARYVGQVQGAIVPGVKGQILSKVEKILLTQPFKGEVDPFGKRS